MKTQVQQTGNSESAETAERRRSERVDLVVRVDYKTVDELFSEFARNINEGGMFVETETPPELGSPVALQFRVPGSEDPIQVMGRVARITEGDLQEPPGMGIEFEDLDEQSRDLINQLVRNLRVGAS
ncbi:MAG: TIGR02266 family protein [Myxococcota bacterium]